jgi:hypothetical protein
MFGSNTFCVDENSDIEIRTGSIAGYKIGAGSKVAGIRMRCLKRRLFEVSRFLE